MFGAANERLVDANQQHEDHDEPAKSRGQRKSKLGRQIIKSKQHFVSPSGQVRISNLVESFGQYLASRNVIGRPHSLELSSPAYERLSGSSGAGASGKSTRGSKLVIKEPARTNFDEFCWGSSNPSQRPIKWTSNKEYGLCKCRAGCCWCRSFWSVQPAKGAGQWRACTCSSGSHRSSSSSSRKPTRQLLGAFLSGSSETSRVRLLTRLLRAPIVLAALFSLALAASILVLYTLSFRDHQVRLGSSSSFGPNPNTSTGTSNIQDLLGLVMGDADRPKRRPDSELSRPDVVGSARLQHHINSRHLQLDQQEAARQLQQEAEPPLAHTECATYEGVAEEEASVFRGIPYALPPVGARRWTRPSPIWWHPDTCKAGERRQARHFRAHCLQVSPFSRQVSGDEDCLYMDVYVPKNSSSASKRPLPVMVYIHGGFLAYGSSGQGDVNWFAGRPSGQLASELEVVIVALNYRLQALGFMALEQLAESNELAAGRLAANSTCHSRATNKGQAAPASSEGNYGLWDQLVAVNWIRRNIESFGGSRDNIVLFGPDSASSLPLALFAAPPDDKQSAGGDESLAGSGRPHSQPEPGQGAGQTSAHLGQLLGRNLFRASWLTNPAVYYELAPELANKHYERLIESQSICSSAAKRSQIDNSDQHLSDNHRRDTLTDCLVGLDGRQVVGEYLGADDPAFRLDDQSSLPIKNIFADQFVTVDGLLVRNSFPFFASRQVAAATAEADADATSTASISQPHSLNANDSKTGANNNAPNDNDNDDHHSKLKRRMLVGSSAQAVEYWPCPRDLYQWNWEDFRRYVGTSLNSFSQETYFRAREMYQVPQNDELNWPRSPVETYLSMVSDIKQVCPINELSERFRARGTSMDRYIVEWRPSDQLSASLRQPGNNCGAEQSQAESIKSSHEQQQQRLHKPRFAFHYWDLMAFFGFQFEQHLRPNEMDIKFQQKIRKMVKEFVWNDYDYDYDEQLERKQRTGPGQQQNDPNGHQDDHQKHSNGIHDNHSMKSKRENQNSGHDEDLNDDHDGFRLFALDGSVRRVKEFKQNECKMWSRFLKQSYAWIS